MRILLCEGLNGAIPFIVDRAKITQESIGSEGRKYTKTTMPGRLSVCDCVNGNRRKYRKEVWEKNLKKGSTLSSLIESKSAFGLLEHPEDGQVTLGSPLAITVTEATLDAVLDSDGKQIYEVNGVIEVLDTPDGRKLTALVDAGYNPMVSSRGFGSLESMSDEDGKYDDVCDDYVCEGWDVVLKPSFVQAQLKPQREIDTSSESNKSESKTSKSKDGTTVNEMTSTGSMGTVDSPASTLVGNIDQKDLDKIKATEVDTGNSKKSKKSSKSDKSVKETCDVDCPCCSSKMHCEDDDHKSPYCNNADCKGKGKTAKEMKNLGEDGKTGPGTAASAISETSQKTETMNINEIKSSIGGLRNQDITKLTPKQFAEGLAHASTLHDQIATYIAEDATRSYAGGQLHQELEHVEEAWSDTQLAPSRRAEKMQENNLKLMKVTKVVVESTITLKKKLSEAFTKQAHSSKLMEEVIKRGRQWKTLAEARGADLELTTSRYDLSLESLDTMADRTRTLTTESNSDITELGKRVLNLEFQEQVQESEDIQKLLKEAKKPEDIVSIREMLDPDCKKDEDGDDYEEDMKDKDGMDYKKSKKSKKCGMDYKKSKSKCESKKLSESISGNRSTMQITKGVTMSEPIGDSRRVNEAVEMTKRLSASVNG